MNISIPTTDVTSSIQDRISKTGLNIKVSTIAKIRPKLNTPHKSQKIFIYKLIYLLIYHTSKERMVEEAIQAISDLWSMKYVINDRDKTFLRKPVRGKFVGVNYGIYCGPMTDPSYAQSYEEGHPYGDPVDGLDFLCYLHDKFFEDPIADELFVQSIDVLNTHRMIGQKFNISGTRNLLAIMRRSFNLWRCIR